MEASEIMSSSGTVQAIDLLNGSTLAYVGDAVYELAVRKHVLSKGITQVNHLHRAAVTYVGAVGQAKVMLHWIKQNDFLTAQEITMYKRGRNHKANTKAKNASIGDYRQATGFESLLGWLALTEQTDRLNQLIKEAITMIDEGEQKNE